MKKFLTILSASLIWIGVSAQDGNSSWWERVISGSKAKSKTEKPAETPAESEPALNVQEVRDTLAAEDSVTSTSFEVRIALVLPFAAGSEKPNYPSFDFYSGALAAVGSLSKQDPARICLNVYDCADSQFRYKRIAPADVIVGPISADDILKLSGRLGDQKFIISPLDQSATALADSIPVIQYVTPYDIQYRELAKWAGERLTDELIVIGNSEESEACYPVILDQLQSDAVNFKVIECASYDNLEEIFSMYAGTSGKKRFLLASENEKFCRNILRAIAGKVAEGLKAETFCTAKIRSVAMGNEEKFSCNLHIAASYFIDDDSEAVREFSTLYQEMYGEAPKNSFSYQGYDIFSYIIRLARTYGPSWADYLTTTQEKALQSDIRFIDSEVGFINSGVRRIKFNLDGTSVEVH